ncbi:CU044_2847 family protein [Kitasatospora sp. NPDC086801]|uniref:CU044_2847 family protein n=1 Tax=Kitasatospora sp. NPDC086801 TaxID=3364066 RepID=UPI00381978CB
MSELVQVVTPEGTFWARIEEQRGPRDVALRRPSYQLDDLAGTLQTVVGNVRSGLRAAAPDEFTLEFGIELSVKTGVLVSAVTGVDGKASLKVTATWRKNGEPAVSGSPNESEESDDSNETGESPESGEPAASAESTPAAD